MNSSLKSKKRAKPFAANNASIKAMEKDGWTCFVVEQRIPHTFITRDVYGFADLLCCSPTRGIMLVQVTGGSNMAARMAKVVAEPRHAIWLASGGRIQVHCWVKRAGKKARECRIAEITPVGVKTFDTPSTKTFTANDEVAMPDLNRRNLLSAPTGIGCADLLAAYGNV